MFRTHRWILAATLIAAAASVAAGAESAPAALPNPFYAMDTAFHGQLDLVRELGFAGACWTEQSPEKVQAAVAEIEKRGLKMFTIYCAAKVTPEGELTCSPTLPQVMEALKGHGTIVWLHIGGKGPDFQSLTATSPVVEKLRVLAAKTKDNGLRVAIYPHVGEWTARFGDAVKLAKAVNHAQFGVTFNLCHCLAMGDEEKIPELLEGAKDVLFTVTICGADKGVTGGRWDRLIQTLDQGTFDVGGVLKKLKQVGFTGPIGFQGYGIRKEPRAILEPTIAAWRRLSAAAAEGK